VPTWRFLTNPLELNNIIAELVNSLIKRQGVKHLADLIELMHFMKHLEQPLVQDFEQRYLVAKQGFWTKAKGALHIKPQAPKLTFEQGDFFTSPLDHTIEGFLTFQNFICKDETVLIEVSETGLNALLQRILTRFKTYEIDYYEQFGLFEFFKKQHFEQLQAQIVTKVQPKGTLLWDEGSLC
jgi:hypothetical protein